MKKAFILILALAAWGRAAHAGQAAASLYNQANSDYRAGSFEKAAALYEQAAAAGVHNSDLYYNLGNAWYRRGDRGKARLWWERAERLSPRDPDLRANLALLQNQLSEALALPQKPMPTDFLRSVRDLAPAGKWGLALSISIWTFWLLLFLFLILRPGRLRRLLLILDIIFILIMLLFGIGFGFRYGFEQEPAAAVLADKVSVRSGPGDSFNEQFELPAGAKVLIQECGNGYCKIELPPGMVGWVEQKTVERI